MSSMVCLVMVIVKYMKGFIKNMALWFIFDKNDRIQMNELSLYNIFRFCGATERNFRTQQCGIMRTQFTLFFVSRSSDK